jgi:hypothetical protein
MSRLSSTVRILITTIVSLVGILYWHWSWGGLAAYYLVETFLLIIFGAIYLFKISPDEARIVVYLTLTSSFALVLGIVFVGVLYPPSAPGLGDAIPWPSVCLNSAVLFITLAISAISFKPRQKPYSVMATWAAVAPVLIRILVLFFALVFGAAVTELSGTLVGYLVGLICFTALTDWLCVMRCTK